MPTDDHPSTDSGRVNRGRLRRSGRQLVRLGTVLTVISLVVALLAGWATRSLLDHLQSNSAELLDGSATVTLQDGDERTLYVTGGLVAPGELVPTPVDQISCTVTGPTREVPFESLAEQGRRVGIDTTLARLQVVGSFVAEESGEHELDCDGLGVVVAPEVGPASAIARLGGLALGSLGTFLGLTMMLIGGVLLLFLRGGEEPEEEDLDDAAPPAEGADEWWEDEAGESRRGAGPDQTPGGVAADSGDAGGPGDEGTGEARGIGELGGDAQEDDYVEVSEDELAAMSDEQIQELVDSGALIFVDEDDDRS
ncbi:hypothetical protein [Ornithinimicrobium flavum]|uniref:hypothetical protein n=1 Tax=Ornithinimicrobium flavum TaxID=1288636 RepID=UPI00106F782E|nr:hypothetical protein [Ornithinimicrobium flavum]